MSDHSSSVKRKRSLKQQLRDTRRLLSKDDLPETVRQSKQRVLDMLTEEVKEKERSEREKKINKKYKMIKFFEKRKIVRRLKSLHNQLKTVSCDDEKEGIISEINILRGDLNYVTYYPNGEKYIALNPTSSQTSQQALQTKKQIHQEILSKVNEGLLSDAMDCIRDTPSSPLIDKNEESNLLQSDRELSVTKVNPFNKNSNHTIPTDETDSTITSTSKKLKSDPFFM